MRINVACGKQTWDGYYCVDAVGHPKASRPPDLIHAFLFSPQGELINPLPLADESAEELCNFHFIEHVYRWEAPAIVAEFRRLLVPSGRLIMELPDIAKAAQHLLKGAKDQMCMWPLYGDPGTQDPYMCHRWGYTPTTITQLLHDGGFRKIKVCHPKTHGARINRDMRVEAVK